METLSKKTLAETLVLANKIETKTNNNEALGRAILSFQDEFNCRRADDPVDADANINFASDLIEMFLKNTRDIREMAEDIRHKLVFLADNRSDVN